MSNEHNNLNSDIVLTFEEVVLTTGCDADWVLSLLEENVITVSNAGFLQENGEQSTQDTKPVKVNASKAQNRAIEHYFTGHTLARIRRAQRICRDFDASVPAVGLILELLDELESYRKQLK